MNNRRERKTSGESTASDSSETASCRPYYLPETPAEFSSSQVARSATPSTWYAPCSSSTSRVGDYSQSPSDSRDFHRGNQPCSSCYSSSRLPLSATPLNKSGEEKRRLSPSWSTPDPKQTKLTHVDKTVAYKEGKPDDRELDEMAGKICSKWQELGLRLDISQDKLDEIDANKKRKAYRMLLYWRNTTASTTLYRDLYYALCHHRVGLNNVAKEFCDKSGEEKRILSPSWSTPDPKEAKLTHVDKTIAFKESKPGDLELNDLAGKIGTKWQKLGLGLGISQNVLNEIKTNGEDRPYEMLLRWRDTTASTTLYRDLYCALCHHRVGLNNVAKEFCVTDSEASTKDIFDLKFCRSKLADHYKKTATVPTSVWSKNCLVDIHQFYTRLSWVKEEQTLAGFSRSELEHYTDVFTANKNGVVPKRILVQGQTGIGKSTFVKKLAVDWAELDDTTTEDKQKDILKKFELLVVVKLKEVSKCQSLKDVISRSSIFAREEKYLTDSLLNYITNNQDKVLLVFDGYDEYRCGRNSEIYEIFSGNELRNCCVLITTRISKADELRAFTDLHADITGFGEENRKTFMKRMLGSNAEAERLRFHLFCQNLYHLAKVPLLLLFFCTLWKKGKLKSFPQSKTKLYLAIVQCVLDHNHGKDSPARFGKVDDFKEILTEIGKVALECLLQNDHVFEYDQFSDAIRCDESLIFGLFQVTEYAENLRPAGIVSFIHKSIQEFLAAWFVTYRCVPEGNLGGIEQDARTLEDCAAWRNVFQFVCGLSDDGAVKVFQHFTSVRISDPSLDLAKTISDEENEADVPLSDVTHRHKRFIDLVDGSFKEVQSKAALLRHWLDCIAGIILITPERPFPKDIPKMTLANEVAYCKAIFFDHVLSDGEMSSLCEFQECFDCLRVPLRITENSAAPQIGDFLRHFKTVGCEGCSFDCVFRYHNGKAQFYITRLGLCCDDHARLFTQTITISTPSPSANLWSKQSCLKFLRSLHCFFIKNAQNVKDLGAVIRNCKHLKTIELDQCGDGVCELLDQIPNPSSCSLSFKIWNHRFFRDLDPGCPLTELAGVLPRFNVTALSLELDDCCAAAVNRLCSITHQTLKQLTLESVSLTLAAAAGLGQSLSEMSSLGEFELIGLDGSLLQAEEMEALFGGINKTLPSLQKLYLEHFNARGSLAPFTKRFQFFPNLFRLRLVYLNMDEHDLRGLLESLTSFPNLKSLDLRGNPLGSQDRIESIVRRALPQVVLYY